MKRFTTHGEKIKQLREARERGATQKEFAHEVRISERKLRLIENANAAVAAVTLDNMAKALGVRREALVFATDTPRLVADANGMADAQPPQEILVPRCDYDIASVTTDGLRLVKEALGCKAVVCKILTPLTEETEGYAEDLFSLLQSLSWNARDILVPVDGRQELALSRRVRQLLVLLRGNDVWVYQTSNLKRLPERHTPAPPGEPVDWEMQLIVALGPPGDYGETTLRVEVDHGQPWIMHR